MHSAVRNWLQRGELEKLENVVLEGRGSRLLSEHSQDLRTRVFLKGLPNYLTKISQVHDAVARGSLAETQKIISEESKKKLAIAKDSCGVPLLHKAVYYDQPEIVAWLIENYPIAPQQKDREGRTALHYCCACKDSDSIWDTLIEGGCDASVCDKRGNPASYYLEHSAEVELPEEEMTTRRRKSTGKESMDFKPSNIRIWIHNKDIGKLQQVLWEGHGSKLRCETSNNPRIRKFLEAVPFIMGTIKDIHATVINNDLEGLKKKLDEPPISPIVLCGKDSNGLNALHKAAGLGYTDVAREILERSSATVAAQDNEGKTPLHYAAALKDDGVMYDLLTEHGADESKLDNRQKAPAFYKNRPSDVDLSNLSLIPEAPRVSDTYPKSWDWRILEMGQAVMRGMKKVSSDDSAFGSAESTMKDSDGSNGKVNGMMDYMGDFVEQRADDEQQESEEAATPNGDEQNGDEDEANDGGDENEDAGNNEEDATNENEGEQEEKASSDDDVVTGPVTEPTKDEEDGPEAAANEDGVYEESPKIEESVEHEERNEPSTGDSGVDDPAQDEEQVIVGEHKEPAEVELTEGSMGRDPEVEGLLGEGNMEQLAVLVLNGDGRRLIGRQTGNPELQAFIDNVPTYMGKIRAVHLAARDGNLRDLQSALDRRKFAVARDASSPHGATPLHVAVVFGNTAVIRYLAGRFPETANAIDLDGRTPLHYAATLADNGHYYNLLLHLGANPLEQDNFGQKADYYKQNRSDLSHKKLLRDFGASEKLADEMLTDKVPGGDIYSARRDVSEPEILATLERCFRLLAGNRRTSIPKTPSNADDSEIDIPIFRTEEGQYLATSLGDPLIKGLTEVANARPKDPITYLATYLYNFASKNKTNEQESDVLIIPDREEGHLDNVENETFDDAGYPRSPDSDVPESTFSNPNRDEHGQSMIHFAAVRSYSKDGLYHLLLETQVNVGFRDELYRTARDVAEQANIRENVEEIDRFVVYLAARGETEKLVELLLEGYDHILDAEDDGVNIINVAAQREHEATVQFLQSIPNYVNQREEVHAAIRAGDEERAKELLSKNNGGGKLLAVGKNSIGRCALHIAVLREDEEIAKFIAKTYPETLRSGDNLERTSLHYAMGVPSVEVLSNILIKAGAKRIVKDLKSRQPSYYFMNKSDIERLQEEEKSMTA
ncbi:PREDICTED: uncharacterized protein LOC105564509 isoform X2 [Vollenhovia emeryi]|uniref:uncharacterized protein LOC105564509 isoform X2 n=1 Tax=Vollenhovia emeryi TaxID=411798 RepID=UPI0005F54A8A|nr:PREDICTED: uncharacterized protein LOC105564509 isoform X2 [Vollenhovia emeryi]